jgi:hypothetical protein
MKRMRSGALAMAFLVPLMLTGVAVAPLASASTVVVASGSGGHGSGSSGGGSTRSGSGSGSGGGRNVQAPSNSGGQKTTNGGGRNVQAPSNSGGQKTTNGGGRNVQAPSNSGGKSMPLTSNKVVVNPPSSRLSVPTNARASGSSSYSYQGHSYTYSQASYHSYYSQYHGGYPVLGSSAYWTLYDSPYYAPNYLLFGNPWYHHAYPDGLILSNGEFVPAAYSQSASHSSALAIVFGVIALVFVLALVAGLVLYYMKRRTPTDTFGRGI